MSRWSRISPTASDRFVFNKRYWAVADTAAAAATAAEAAATATEGDENRTSAAYARWRGSTVPRTAGMTEG